MVFYSGRNPGYIKKNKISILNNNEVQQEINDVIYQNSYRKCVGKNEAEVKRVVNIEFGKAQ